jgi:hypothetical protein
VRISFLCTKVSILSAANLAAYRHRVKVGIFICADLVNQASSPLAMCLTADLGYAVRASVASLRTSQLRQLKPSKSIFILCLAFFTDTHYNFEYFGLL